MASNMDMDSLLQSLEDYPHAPSTMDPSNRIEELMPVPNTEFVALIVGRNGHKIKAIRERTDTFIKTPLRNEAPIFKIAGNVHNVNKAKQEITDIVQRLQSPQYRLGNMLGEDPLTPRTKLEVRVPFKFVGLVVGFQGSTIMEIQCKTKTHIQTPAHGGEPIFEIIGEQKNVWIAKVMIQFYIEYRTGLRVLDVESLVDENIDPTVLAMLFKHGVSNTLDAIMSRLDTLLISDTSALTFSAPDVATHIDPVQAIAMQLDAYDMDDNSRFESILDPNSTSSHMEMMSSPPEAAPLVDFMQPPPMVVSPMDYEPHFAPANSYANEAQLRATEWQFDATNSVEYNYQAITSQAINTLFPDNVPQVAYAAAAANNNNNWMEPLTPPPMLMQQQPPPHHVDPAAGPDPFDQSFMLDDSFWAYVAHVNNIPPEQVL